MTTLRDEEVTAIKDYQCDLCGGKINKGEVYHYSAYVSDHIYNFRSHIHCQSLSEKLKMYDQVNMGDDGLDSELFGEIVRENFRSLFSPKEINVSEMAVELYKKLGE